jgi:dienelactone hydrolase
MAFLVAALTSGCAVVGIQREEVRFSSLDVGAGREPTNLSGYMFKPEGGETHPGLVFLHGCGGLRNSRGQIESREADWAASRTRLG